MGVNLIPILFYIFFINPLITVQIDERLIGTWIMVKAEKDGLAIEDESISNKYTYTYAKNGDYILDIRMVRKATEENGMSIVDFPRFKWEIRQENIELRPVFVNPNAATDFRHVKRYEFRQDTLVTAIRNFKWYYLKKK